MSDVGIFGDVPSGRRLDTDYDPRRVGSVGILKPYSRELGDLLRRQIREIRDRDLRQDGKRWLDKDGSEYEIVRELVDPTAPEEALVTAFVVRDNLVVYLKERGAKHEPKVVNVGTMSGSRVS